MLLRITIAYCVLRYYCVLLVVSPQRESSSHHQWAGMKTARTPTHMRLKNSARMPSWEDAMKYTTRQVAHAQGAMLAFLDAMGGPPLRVAATGSCGTACGTEELTSWVDNPPSDRRRAIDIYGVPLLPLSPLSITRKPSKKYKTMESMESSWIFVEPMNTVQRWSDGSARLRGNIED